MTGGSGKDRFSFTDWDDLGFGTLCDVITDFTRGQDRIDLSAIDADSTFAGRPGLRAGDD
ncbi:M10 family metallopeptidase C-terminal domain-containing protein [Azohydromonas australica]|uniref:M10 family metallopeptidase C-terminal domain-containing protein n=1 Tax=Azohydromonas australica TaxID=364039 RepID=UPI00041A09F3|nr:type I secretion C-terminal target domain-containing protein [Azohydromonas australica]